jgi:hypothetical protein
METINQILGTHREFVVIERKVLNELLEYADSLKNEPGIHTKGIGKGIEYSVDKIKENNIYNKDFEIKN